MKRKYSLILPVMLLVGCASNTTSTATTTEESSIQFGEKITISGNGLSVKDNTVTISRPGTYVVSGESDEGKIVVDSQVSGDVNIILRNVNLSSSSGPVITVSEADTTYLYIEENTESTLSSTGSDSDEETATILSHDDLYILGSGTLNLTAEEDAIHANDSLYIEESKLNIQSGDEGIQCNDYISLDSTTITITTKDGAQTSSSTFPSDMDFSDDEYNAKGIKCDGDIEVVDSSITVNSEDDALHSNSNITITNSTLNLKSSDDGIHADESLTINSGNITVEQSYEGLEAKEITINDGEISITSSDDGINTADGSYTGNDMQSDGSVLTIHGGTIIINAEGDGVDMNGDGLMDGGTLTVYGPSSGADGALDYNGTFTVNGGTILAGGSSEMAVMPSSDSSVNCMMLDASGTVTVKDSEGNVVFTYASDKQYQNLVIASDQLETNQTYTIENGTETTEVTISSNQTNLSSKSNNPMSGGDKQGGPGGQGGGNMPQGPGNNEQMNPNQPQSGEKEA